MARLRGTGIAAVNYPTGMNLGGDPSQALIHATTSGSFVVSLSSADLGQGLKTVIGQIAAETLGISFEEVVVEIGDTDSGPHCMGTFASRATHRVGNAVIAAATEARQALLEVAAEELEAAVADLEGDGHGNLMVKGVPARSVRIADIASMAHSLELRSPLLDHGVLALGLALPDELKLKGREGKQALRRAFADLLPPEVASRGKAGFGVPLARWFREDLRDLAGDVLLADGGLFRRDAIERLLAEHADGDADHGHRLWCLVMLALWQRAHLA